jgi:NDP-sugar pyrophosphorylase family protein
MWIEWEKKIDNCHTLIWYGDSEGLYPISQWLHPGSIPVGNGNTDGIIYDLPNLEWQIRHLAWQGFRDITIISQEGYKGLDLLFADYFEGITLNFVNGSLWDILGQMQNTQQVLLIPGLTLSDADFGSSLVSHRHQGNITSVLSIRGLQFRVGLVQIDITKKITEFVEKPIDRTQLLNSGVVIIDLQKIQTHLKMVSNISHQTAKTDALTSQGQEELNSLLRLLIDDGLLSTIELTGVTGEPWFLDLSILENWVRLDFDYLLSKFTHLYHSSNTNAE